MIELPADGQSMEGAVMSALPKISLYLKQKKAAGLSSQLRHVGIPYGVADRALRCLEIMGACVQEHPGKWVAK